MSGTIDKANFLRNKLITLIGDIPPDAEPKWGKMNPQQMVEHMTDSFREATGKIDRVLITPEEHLPKMQEFLMSDKPFRENTPNKLMPDTPPAPRHEHFNKSVEELKLEVDEFFTLYRKEPSLKMVNPHFGELNYERWVQLLHKHAMHHLKQFGIAEEQCY